MLNQDHVNASTLFSLPPEFVRHENEELHDHPYDAGDTAELEIKSWFYEITHNFR